MGIWDNISGALNKGVEGAGRFADATSLKFRLGEVERKRRDLAGDLGEKLYEAVSSDAGLPEGCEDIVAAMKSCDSEIAQIKAEIESIARKTEASKAASVTYSCPSCGATLSQGARFCHVCGTQLAPVQAAQRAEGQAAPAVDSAGGAAAASAQSYDVPVPAPTAHDEPAQQQ